MAVQATDHRDAGHVVAIDRLLAEAVAAGAAPGLVGAVGSRAGMLHLGSAGLRADGGAPAMTVDTIFWLASMTKLVTTIAAMQMVEAGDLALDEPVAGLLPELANPRVLTGMDAAGVATTRPARGAITLRHLLTHMSGSGYDLMNPALLHARGSKGPPATTSLASLDGPLAADPGTTWTYGFGIDWAGIAIERRSGRKLDRHLAETIFTPLAMTDTGFAVADAAQDRVAATHLRDPSGEVAIIPSPAGLSQDWEFHSGGAGLFGTAADYTRLLRMLLRGGELDGVRVLREATVEAMWANQIGEIAAGRLDTANRTLVLPYDPVSGQAGGWSLLGWRNPLPVRSGRSAGSASWAGVAGTSFWIDRAADLCGVLLAQLLPFADPALAEVQRAFERSSYADAARSRNQQGRNAA